MDEEGTIVEDSAFIDLVYPRAWLYDLEHIKYKDNKYKENTWSVVAEAMGWSDDEMLGSAVDLCKKTWKRLRDNFWRVHKKMHTPSGSGAGDSHVWPLYKKMEFLLSLKKKNTRKTTSNYTPKSKQESSNPKVAWGGLTEMLVIDDNDIGTEEVVAVASTSGLQGQKPTTVEESSSATAAGDKSPLPFEQGHESKKRPPERVNPAPDSFNKKNKTSNKKFEDMLSKGFGSFDKLVEHTLQQKQPSKDERHATANSKFAEYLQMELEDIPAEHQAAIRKELLLCFNEAKEKRNL